MKRIFPFIIYLLILSGISGWLMSRMSWIGRVGINLIHKEYKFLKVWYQGAGAVFGVLILLFVLQYFARKKMSAFGGFVIQVLAVMLALVGLWFTYNDFRDDFTHGLMKERFHLGAYLFWLGWISSSLFVMTIKSGNQTAPIISNNKVPLNP